MRRACLPLLLLAFACSSGQGDLSPSFRRELSATKDLSRPLPRHPENSFEERMLWTPAFLTSRHMEDSLVITYRTSPGFRAQGPPSDPDYATYGDHYASLDMRGADLEEFNVLCFNCFVDSPGDLAPSVNFVPVNREAAPKGRFTPPAGAHLIPLHQGENNCRVWIGDLRRDCTDRLDFYVTNRGWNLSEGVEARYEFTGFVLGKLEGEIKVSGWEPAPGQIVLSTAGYFRDGSKSAVMRGENAPERFSIETRRGRKVFEGEVHKSGPSTLGDIAVLDFTSFRGKPEIQYVIRCGTARSTPFRIREHPFDELQWKALNFIFSQRCGYAVEGVHPLCHEDLFAIHEGEKRCFGGGWHDAGDLSQQTLQTGDVAFNLLESALAVRHRAPALAARLEEEARWGLDFLEQVRFPDGSRASSMGLLIWQDGKVGTFDDITSVRVQGMAYDNYLYAGYQAFAATSLANGGEYGKRAERDFAFAEEKFAASGYDNFLQPYEHTFNTPHSLYQATISWAASQLYRLTGEERYAARAREAMDYVLACQRKDGQAAGAFCRDSTGRTLMHSIHQSREQLFVMALAELIDTQPDESLSCMEALSLYAAQLKGTMSATAPYGMIPAGIYSMDEPEDEEAFRQLNVFLPDDAAGRFRTQLQCGVRLDSLHSLRRFPVWFGIYNGNNAVLLSQGKAAAVCSRLLEDPVLSDIAKEQVYWILGKNPFGQSMVYGEGFDYPLMDSFSSGTMTGEIPVGIRTVDDTDTPYWPQVNNACYKEVWTPVAGKLLSLLAEF